MTSDRQFEEQPRAMVSPWDLEQIKEAVAELRAASPRSILADLVEEKIRTIEHGCLRARPDASSVQTSWIAR